MLMKFAGFGSGENDLVISISLITSLVYMLRNSYRFQCSRAASSVFGNPLWNTTSTLLTYIYDLAHTFPQPFDFGFNVLMTPGIAETLLKPRSYTRPLRPLVLPFPLP